jgi:hypothetical protein
VRDQSAGRIAGGSGAQSDDDSKTPPPLFAPYETTADLPKSNTTKDFDVPESAKTAKPPAEVNPAPGV